MPDWVTGQVRPLPRTVPPFRDETVSSYLRRLARANRLDDDAFRAYLTGNDTNHKIPLARLAAVSSLPAEMLCRALPELRDPDKLHESNATRRPVPDGPTSPVCRFCALTRGITDLIIRWRQPEDLICRRHRRWLIDWHTAVTGRQPDLTRQPGIVRAHRLHQKLIHRHGRDLIRSVFNHAAKICKEWHRQGRYDADFHRRMRLFHGPEWCVDRRDPTIEAAFYPQIVALTRLLGAPHWRSHALQAPPRLDRFLDEVRRTVAPTFQWDATQAHRSYDALVNWIRDHRAYPDDPPLPHHLVDRRTWPATS
jgi:hypothetical protein